MGNIGEFNIGDKTKIEQIDIIQNEQSNKKSFIKFKFNFNIFYLFLTRVVYGYLPLVIYLVVKGLKDTQGAFLAISYVFLSQVATTKCSKDALNNFLFASRIALAIISLSISFLESDTFWKSWGIFIILCLISFITLYFNVIKDNQPQPN